MLVRTIHADGLGLFGEGPVEIGERAGRRDQDREPIAPTAGAAQRYRTKRSAEASMWASLIKRPNHADSVSSAVSSENGGIDFTAPDLDVQPYPDQKRTEVSVAHPKMHTAIDVAGFRPSPAPAIRAG